MRARAGADGIARVLARLPARDVEAVHALSANAWVPFRLQARLLRAIDATFGEGDLALLFDVGAAMAQRDLPTVFRPLLRLGRPGSILDMATATWRHYHSHGHWHPAPRRAG